MAFDKTTKEWFAKHPDAQTTIMCCEKCGLEYKPSLGHKCKYAPKQGNTCNDCIHYDACKNILLNSKPEYKNKNLIVTGVCKLFKNKADFVEVVRCGQCKYWKLNPHNLHGGYCRHCEGASIDHFCSYGERK